MELAELKPIKSRLKAGKIVVALKAMALSKGAGWKLPTVRELSSALGVSSATLNDALWELQQQGVIVRRPGSGIYVSSQVKQKTIGLVFGRNIFAMGVSPICHMLLDRLQSLATSQSRRFSFYLDLPTKEAGREPLPVHQDLVEDIGAGKLDGILLVWRHDAEQEQWLRRKNIPVVTFATSPAYHPHTVSVDYGAIIRMGVGELARRGRKRIALVTPFGYTRPLEDDLAAFRQALVESGLDSRSARTWEIRGPEALGMDGGETREEQGYRAVKELFAATVPAVERPDGLLILDDIMTRGAAVALSKLRLEVGRDVWIATHSNKGSPALSGLDEPLIRCEIDPDEIAAAMFRALDSSMAGDPSSAEVIFVRPQLRTPEPQNLHEGQQGSKQ